MTVFLTKRSIQLAILCLLCLSSFFLNLSVFDVDLMEARNFITAKEMVEDGNWMIPTMNGHLRLEKPPLPTWATALSAQAFGGFDDYFSLRFPTALVTCLMVFFCFLLVQQLTKDEWLPFMSASVAASSLLIIQMGMTGTWDIWCHVFMTGAIWALLKAWQSEQNQCSSFVLAGFLLGMSFMSKGPVSFYAMLLPFLIAYLWTGNASKIMKRWPGLILAILVCALISSVWPIYIMIQHPESTEAVAKYESFSWMNRHLRPFYFYLHFSLYAGIWFLPVLFSMVWPWVRKGTDQLMSYKLIIAWMLLSLFFLSIIPEKKERYLLPMSIPMAIAAALWMRRLIQVFWEGSYLKRDWIKFTILAFLLMIASISVPIVLPFLEINSVVDNKLKWSWYFIAFFIPALLFYYHWYTKKPLGFFLSMLFFAIIINLMLVPLIPEAINQTENYHGVWEIRNEKEIAEMPLYNQGKVKYGNYIEIDMIMVWEAGRKIKPWNPTAPPSQFPYALLTKRPFTEINAEFEFDNITFKEIDQYHKSKKDPKKKYWLSIIDKK